MTATGTDIEVTVVLALSDRATEIPVRLPAGATVAEALARSDLGARHPELDLARALVGVFGRVAGRAAVLADGDRVEVYRPLLIEPKARRESRAARTRGPLK